MKWIIYICLVTGLVSLGYVTGRQQSTGHSKALDMCLDALDGQVTLTATCLSGVARAMEAIRAADAAMDAAAEICPRVKSGSHWDEGDCSSEGRTRDGHYCWHDPQLPDTPRPNEKGPL